MRCRIACSTYRDLHAPWHFVATRVGSAPQVIIAVVMTKHRGVLAVLKEVMLVLLCLKPGFEVWHLAHGAEHEPGAPIDPKIAMMMGKVAERVFESIPSAILTTVTLLDHADARSPSTVASVIVACLAMAFVATTIAYNMDSDPALRHAYPAFYGYWPPAPLDLCVCSRAAHGISSIHDQLHLTAGTWATRPCPRRAASACSSSCTRRRS
jgi:hypothetical protein